MNRTQLEHIIRAASQIADDAEIVVVGSQAIHAQNVKLPAIAFLSAEADVYPRNRPERADDIDAAIGELSPFHAAYGYYAHGVSPNTAILPAGWEQRVIRISNANTGGATGLCIDAHDLALSKYAAGREHDRAFNQALIRHGIVSRRKLATLLRVMPVDDEMKGIITARMKADYAAVSPRRLAKRQTGW